MWNSALIGGFSSRRSEIAIEGFAKVNRFTYNFLDCLLREEVA